MSIRPPDTFAYLHKECGTVTEVGDSITANMHADPWFYLPGTTICAQCGEVPDKRCTVVDTGERLDEYVKGLQKQKGTAYHCVRWGIYVVLMTVGAIVTPIITVNAKGQIPQPWNSLFGVVFGVLTAMFPGRYVRLMLCKAGVI